MNDLDLRDALIKAANALDDLLTVRAQLKHPENLHKIESIWQFAAEALKHARKLTEPQ